MKRPILAALLLCLLHGIAIGQDKYDKLADSLIQLKQQDKILPTLEKMLAAHPKDEQLLRSLGYYYIAFNNPDMGEKCIRQALALNPTCSPCYYNLASIYAGRNNAPKALDYLQQCLSLEPKAAHAYNLMGQVNAATGKLTTAIENYNTSISIDSTNPDSYFGRAMVYADQQASDKAIADYDKVIALHHQSYSAYYNRALVKYQKEDMDGSCTDLHTAYTLMKADDPKNSIMEELEFHLGNFCDSAKPSYYYQRGIGRFNLQQYDAAISYYDKGLAHFPDNAMLLSFKGNAFFAMKKYAEAIVNYTATINNKDNITDGAKANEMRLSLGSTSTDTYVKGFMATTYLYMAKAYFALGKYQDGMSAINKAIDVVPDTKGIAKEDYYNVRGNLYLASGKYEQALSDFNLALQVNPGFALGYANRAIAKINLATPVKIRTMTISGDMRGFNANWTLPVKMKYDTEDPNPNLAGAYSDSNKAVELDAQLGIGYYIRWYMRRLMNVRGYCFDLAKAKELGYEVEKVLLEGCKD